MRLFVAGGWLSLGLFVCAFVLEATGWPRRAVENLLGTRLGGAVGDIVLTDVHIEWTSRTAVIEGLSFGPNRQDVQLDRIEVRLGLGDDLRPTLERIAVDGGSLRVSRALVTALEGALEDEDSPDTPGVMPELELSGLRISVETPDYGDLPVGTLHAALLPDHLGEPRLSGRLVPHYETGGSGEILLAGHLEEEELLVVRGAARAMNLCTEWFPSDPTFDPFRAAAPEGSFDLEASANWRFAEEVLPTGKVTLAFTEGSAVLPWLESPEERRLRGVELALEVAFQPGDSIGLWSREAWRATGSASAEWEGMNVTAAARMGRDATAGRLAEFWCHTPALPVTENTLELGARSHWMMDLWDALTPSGELEVAYGLAFPSGWTPDEGFINATDRCATVIADGKAGAAFVGWPNPRDRTRRDQGFPLPLETAYGRVHYAHRAGRQLAEEIGLFGMSGERGEERVELTGSIRQTGPWTRPPEERNLGPEVMHILATSDGVSISEELEQAFDGLKGLEGCEELWTEYLPGAGRLGFRLELVKNEELEELAARLRIDFKDFAARWIEFPLPCNEVNGTLRLTTEGRRDQGRGVTTLDLVGKSDAALGEVRVQGRSEYGAAGPDTALWHVDIDGLDLTNGRLLEVLGQKDPGALEGIEAAGAVGHADVTARFVLAGGKQPRWIEAHASGEGLTVTPRTFPMETRSTFGRLLAHWEENEDAVPGPTDLRFGVIGNWADQTPVWLGARFPGDGPARLRALGAGVDPLDADVLRATETALSQDEAVDLDASALESQGKVDFEANLLLAPKTSDLESGEIALQVRVEELGIDGTSLVRELRGEVTWDPTSEGWRGDGLTGLLGRTAIRLDGVTLSRSENGGWDLFGRLSAESVPLDREHLRYFLDGRTVRTLIEEFDLRGRFDVEGAELAVRASETGDPFVRLAGKIRVRSLYAMMGVPIEVNFANDVDLDLRYEAGRVRAMARVGSMAGSVAERRLEDARLQLTYIEPRLTIESLDGAFEGGRLRSMGGRGGSTFFAIDLEPPFPFVLGARLAQVEMGRFLRGVFNSTFANRGRLDANLHARGDLEHLTGIVGGGNFELSESALWAVPVFQEVLSQLGFPTAATFNSMRGPYTLDSGVLRFPDLRLESDVLSLVGSGLIDFDGSVRTDMEVQYTLVDQLGPFTRLIYLIQNSLLRISVRGDMSRPEVVVEGLFSQFFAAPSEKQRLPLPGYSDLPTRF